MNSNDHITLIRLRLGPWRDDAQGGALFTDLRPTSRAPAPIPQPAEPNSIRRISGSRLRRLWLRLRTS